MSLTRDERIGSKAPILCGIRHHEQITLHDGVSADGEIHWGLAHPHPDLCLEELARVLDEADQRDGGLAHQRSHLSDLVKRWFTRGVKDAIGPQHRKAVPFTPGRGRNGLRHVCHCRVCHCHACLPEVAPLKLEFIDALTGEVSNVAQAVPQRAARLGRTRRPAGSNVTSTSARHWVVRTRSSSVDPSPLWLGGSTGGPPLSVHVREKTRRPASSRTTSQTASTPPLGAESAPWRTALLVSSWMAIPVGTAKSAESSTGGPVRVIRCSPSSYG